MGGGGDWNPLALKEFRVSPHPLPALGPGGYEGKPEDYEDQRTMMTVEVGVSRRPMFLRAFWYLCSASDVQTHTPWKPWRLGPALQDT